MTRVKEIVERDDKIISTTEEALLVIKEYIRVRKGYDVNPVANDMMGIHLMAHAYPVAVAWFRDNKEYLQ
jgi:hypothetical protein